MGEVNLSRDRAWYLSRYTTLPGWRIDSLDGVKIWRSHRDQLIKRGLLEQSGEGRSAMFRITDAGRQALQPPEPSHG